MRDAINTKYSLVRYYYTNLFTISTQGTGTFYKPMFFEFPSDNKAFSDIISNVMLGSALKLSINANNLTYVNYDYYFPAGWWCSVDGTQAQGECFYS
jgi:alpha-glucosidase (family GH31 glycosyl hydrolase)